MLHCLVFVVPNLYVLDPVDCDKLIRVARDIRGDDGRDHASRWSFLENLMEEAHFVPVEVFVVMVEFFDDWQQLSRVLQLDWLAIGAVGVTSDRI